MNAILSVVGKDTVDIDKNKIFIGRLITNDIQFTNRSISRRQCVIEVIGDKVGADKEVMMMLEHMILSHHYNPEYGSPKKPMFPEAQMLHILDLLDASLFDMKKAMDGIEVGTVSDGIWSLDKRRVYKSKI